jgi:hypothetical protein
MKKQTTNTDKKSEFDFRTIKTVEDACKKTGYDLSKFPADAVLGTKFGRPLIAINKLMIVTEAVNNGWKPNWNNQSEYKYFPWHWLQKDASHPSGFGFSGSDCDNASASTGLGSLLCCDTAEKAMYIAEQFKKEWEDFLLGLY